MSKYVWVCSNCVPVVINCDYSHLDYSYQPDEAQAKADKINAGLELLGWLTPSFDDETGDGVREISTRGCDVCSCHLADDLRRFTQ